MSPRFIFREKKSRCEHGVSDRGLPPSEAVGIGLYAALAEEVEWQKFCWLTTSRI